MARPRQVTIRLSSWPDIASCAGRLGAGKLHLRPERSKQKFLGSPTSASVFYGPFRRNASYGSKAVTDSILRRSRLTPISGRPETKFGKVRARTQADCRDCKRGCTAPVVVDGQARKANWRRFVGCPFLSGAAVLLCAARPLRLSREELFGLASVNSYPITTPSPFGPPAGG